MTINVGVLANDRPKFVLKPVMKYGSVLHSDCSIKVSISSLPSDEEDFCQSHVQPHNSLSGSVIMNTAETSKNRSPFVDGFIYRQVELVSLPLTPKGTFPRQFFLCNLCLFEAQARLKLVLFVVSCFRQQHAKALLSRTIKLNVENEYVLANT